MRDRGIAGVAGHRGLADGLLERRSAPRAAFIPAHIFNTTRVRRAERAERFDQHFGTDTDHILYPWQMNSLRRWRTKGVHPYEATSASLICAILQSLPVDTKDFEFVDLGSGKGRVLLVASEFGFTRIVGIEISRELHEIAQRNVRRYRAAVKAAAAIEVRNHDATGYRFGRAPVVLFLFNPFDQATLRQVLAELETSLSEHPRDALVIYVNPRFRRDFDRSPFFREVARGGTWSRPWSRYVVYRGCAGARP